MTPVPVSSAGADWIRANLASLQRLLRPLFARMADDPDDEPSLVSARGSAHSSWGPMLGWMSTRVLGQYDLLVLEDEAAEDQDIVYYVGPNLVALERRYAFHAPDFHLWLALHEVTHRAQFMGVPWMREHYLGLVGSLLDGADAESFDLVAALRLHPRQAPGGYGGPGRWRAGCHLDSRAAGHHGSDRRDS